MSNALKRRIKRTKKRDRVNERKARRSGNLQTVLEIKAERERNSLKGLPPAKGPVRPILRP